jgi:hypothetical protein
MELKEYLQQKYQGSDSFLEHIIFPIFGEEQFEDAYNEPLLDSNPELRRMAQASGIASIYHIGTINLPFNPVEIFDVHVSNHIQIARNRVGVQQLIRSIMATFSSAFMIFHYDDDVAWDWRFSYCHKGESNEQTDTKRYTFLLGPNQSCRTAAENFTKLMRLNGNVKLENLAEAFDVEALSDEFFSKYKQHYEKFVEYITGKKFEKQGGKYAEKTTHKPHAEMYASFGRDDKAVRDYIKKLLGRIVFLHFLQKKGWLGVPADGQWGAGDPQFMKSLFEHASRQQQEDFLDVVLEPLFSEGLDKPCPNGQYDTRVALPYGSVIRVPYLNGGLFERDEYDEITTRFPREFFAELLEFLSQYNFTIDENDPSEAEVGVDPEMLGRIFENLLEDNKDKGAYYTPKEIVRYMCRESLVSYLTTQSIQSGNANPREKVEAAIRQLIAQPERIVPRMKEEQKARFGEALRRVRICDPAIGSGAFPMGLLSELVRLRVSIGAWAQGSDGRLLVDDYAALKREIVCDNIYGVDIERGAIDIARLRFWLSIVVDEHEPRPLPNLDYKFMQGNSLLTTFAGEYVNLDTNGQSHGNILKMRSEKRHLFELKTQYYSASGDRKHQLDIEIKNSILQLVSLQLDYEMKSWYHAHTEQQSLIDDDVTAVSFRHIKDDLPADKLRIVEIGQQLRQQLADTSISLQKRAQTDICFFDWRIMFTEVFTEGGGFDIVIGNPPYGAKLSDSDKEIFKKNFVTAKTIKDVQKGSLDTYTIFIEQAYNLMNTGASMAMIVPISITSSDALSGVHRLLLQHCEDIHISSYAVRPKPVFKNAVVNTSIVTFRKTLQPCENIFATKMYRKGHDFNLQYLIDHLKFAEVTDFLLQGRIPKLSEEIECTILKKLRKNNKLGPYIKEAGAPIYYRTTGGRYFKVVTNYPTGSTKEKPIFFDNTLASSIGCILSSNLSFWFYQIYSNNLDWKGYEISEFYLPELTSSVIQQLEALYKDYLADIERNANVRQTSGESSYNVSQFKEYKIGKSKAIIDKIDDLICPLYGLTQEETEFIKNYDIEFRLSDDE